MKIAMLKRVNRSRLALILLVCLTTVIHVRGAFINGPIADEMGHLIAGAAILRTGDSSFYRVNPPLPKLVSGGAIELLFAPRLEKLYPASKLPSGVRREFEMAEHTVGSAPGQYRHWFVWGRLLRVPIVLLGSWGLWRWFRPDTDPTGLIAVGLWLSSPLILGHGSLVMPDAMSAVAMIGLLAASMNWLANRDGSSSLLLGLVWGLSLTTKFTFCPIWLIWPVGMITSLAIAGQLRTADWWQVPISHLIQGVIAWMVVVLMYFGQDVGVPLARHGFASDRFISLAETLPWLPSPLPMSFLLGIDEQQLDIERGFPTYVLGRWYRDGAWWYYLVGLIIKEQIALYVLSVMAIVGLVSEMLRRDRYHVSVSQRKDDRTVKLLAVLTATSVFSVIAVLSVHPRMALNVRYVFPALPGLYLMIGLGCRNFFRRFPRSAEPLAWLLTIVIVGEIACITPHHFAYANPVFGGSRRIPPALHDSNFDGGQDLWLLEQWQASNAPKPGCRRLYAIDTHVPVQAIGFPVTPPRESDLQRLLDTVDQPSPGVGERCIELVVMRGLGVPAPWTRSLGGLSTSGTTLLRDLLKYPPDEWLSPTLVIYRCTAL